MYNLWFMGWKWRGITGMDKKEGGFSDYEGRLKLLEIQKYKTSHFFI